MTATADDEWDWLGEEHRKPVKRAVDARWVPLSQVRGVALEVTGVESSDRQEGPNHYGLQFWASWTLVLVDGEPIRLRADQTEDARNRLRTFVGTIRSAS